MKTLNYKIDHLEQTTIIHSVYPNKRPRITTTSQFHGEVINNKTGGLAPSRIIEKHLKEFYKRKKGGLEELEKMGWDRFVRGRVMDMDGRTRDDCGYRRG